MNRLGTAFLCSLLAGCAARAPHPDAFAFGVMGDIPYTEDEERVFPELLKRTDAEALAFVIHVGDFKRERDECSDSVYAQRKAQFDSSAHPLIFTPGDNDWTDCRRPKIGPRDPIERLARLRQVFFANRQSLGRSPIETAAQDACLEPPAAGCGCGAHPENRQWTRGAVRFVTLNIPGSDNNVGIDRANDEEARCRNEANRRWLESAVHATQAADVHALVVVIHANPWVNERPGVYDDFLQQMAQAAWRLGKPILFVHGDTHTYRVDMPFVDAMGYPRARITRLEPPGSPKIGWVKVTVDRADPEMFRFEPRLLALDP